MSTRFDAVSDLLTRTSPAPTGTSTGYTWMGWVYLSVDRNAPGVICVLYNHATTPSAWIMLYVDSTGTALRTDISGSTGAIEGLATGTWYHLAITYQGTSVKVYVNGALDTTRSTTSTVNGVLMAMGSNGASWYNGRLAGVKIWNSVLSDAEIAAEYPYYDDIKGGAWAVYPMEQSGSRTNDVSGNGRHLTENGTLTSEADPPGVSWYVGGSNQDTYPAGVPSSARTDSSVVTPASVSLTVTGTPARSFVGSATLAPAPASLSPAGVPSRGDVGSCVAAPDPVTIDAAGVPAGSRVNPSALSLSVIVGGVPAMSVVAATVASLSIVAKGAPARSDVGASAVEALPAALALAGVPARSGVGSVWLGVTPQTLYAAGVPSRADAGSGVLVQVQVVAGSGIPGRSDVASALVTPQSVSLTVAGIQAFAAVSAATLGAAAASVAAGGIPARSHVGNAALAQSVVAAGIPPRATVENAILALSLSVSGVPARATIGSSAAAVAQVQFIQPSGVPAMGVVEATSLLSLKVLVVAGVQGRATLGGVSVEPVAITIAAAGISPRASVTPATIVPAPAVLYPVGVGSHAVVSAAEVVLGLILFAAGIPPRSLVRASGVGASDLTVYPAGVLSRDTAGVVALVNTGLLNLYPLIVGRDGGITVVVSSSGAAQVRSSGGIGSAESPGEVVIVRSQGEKVTA